MPATPAWPPQSTPRLFLEATIAPDAAIRIDGPQAHYLLSVLRAKPGDPVKLFDDRTGEWLATVAHAGKRDLTLQVTDQLRPREPVPDLWLCAAPLKKGRIDWTVEKACELGAARIVPVLTRRTVVDRLNLDRLRAHAIEAAEQCDRTALPELAEPVKLAALLRDWPAERALFFADETGGAPASTTMAQHRGPGAVLIGPEGGFDVEEREAIRALPQAYGVTLGPRILRAETAAAAAISVWMASAGDW
ncbi:MULTISPECIES: 16S rRNA (uracil(1498)-N(3))-methyltransferase [Sphingomonas]|uniref:16S rRNA (uracil(1498)-N(3))-methyltransferase n=1 Tax=Sphingomonas TaxID=13687 RepID=UPI000F7F0663|nr:16S rRNA (uracil(1498)-N(3))-methyltransferase [Sphingomonas sp. ABOLF]RSV13800.1 16S rRNA (uracil(1498)-N(3))-methyltransferase [Sphingomonas sp. ABOLF]GLK19684.1 ribosomal RNA small subunit methyltransferase E [Microbacterium terregens]